MTPFCFIVDAGLALAAWKSLVDLRILERKIEEHSRLSIHNGPTVYLNLSNQTRHEDGVLVPGSGWTVKKAKKKIWHQRCTSFIGVCKNFVAIWHLRSSGQNKQKSAFWECFKNFDFWVMIFFLSRAPPMSNRHAILHAHKKLVHLWCAKNSEFFNFVCYFFYSTVHPGAYVLVVYAFLVKEIKRNMEEGTACITHIRRSRYNASHFMASYGRTQDRTAVWLGSGRMAS